MGHLEMHLSTRKPKDLYSAFAAWGLGTPDESQTQPPSRWEQDDAISQLGGCWAEGRPCRSILIPFLSQTWCVWEAPPTRHGPQPGTQGVLHLLPWDWPPFGGKGRCWSMARLGCGMEGAMLSGGLDRGPTSEGCKWFGTL